MILRVPSYYKTFQCIADKCEHSCCIGWEIDIDEDSYDYYMGIEGAFGERLKEQTVTEDEEKRLVPIFRSEQIMRYLQRTWRGGFV